MAEDLRLFLQTAGGTVSPATPAVPFAIPPGSTQETTPVASTSKQSDSDQKAIKVVPKGLRSFDEQDLKFVAEQLVSSNAEFQPLLRDALRPIRARLLGDLERIFADAKATAAQQSSAANAFADYAAGDIPKLCQLLTVATPEQYAVL